MANQRMDISPVLDEICMLNVAWKVISYSKRSLPFRWYRHDIGKIDEENDKNEHGKIV